MENIGNYSERKFKNPKWTAKNEPRASVELNSLKTLWFNTGTICNLTCANCYIESSPTNDRLSYIDLIDVQSYLDEIRDLNAPTSLIGLTGGEPFLNPKIIDILSFILSRGFDVIVLTNAYRAMDRHKKELLVLKETYLNQLQIRVSLDHYSQEVHEKERGKRTFDGTLSNLKWLNQNQFNFSVAARSLTNESTERATLGYQKLFKKMQIDIDYKNKFVIFPEMATQKDVPEITTACWDILKKSPDSMMCATERMIVKNKGEAKPHIVPCTLLAYDPLFNLGTTLARAEKKVYLNHRFCAEFCVLGGASCSSTS